MIASAMLRTHSRKIPYVPTLAFIYIYIRARALAEIMVCHSLNFPLVLHETSYLAS